MICPTCRAAADAQLPAGQHCSDAGCMCGHREPREQCRAEYHQVNWPSGHCDRLAGHPGNHRDQTISAHYQWHDDRAFYPIDITPEQQ